MVSTWITNLMFELFLLAQCDDAVEDLLPVGIAREVIVGDEEALDALCQISPDDLSRSHPPSAGAICAPAH